MACVILPCIYIGCIFPWPPQKAPPFPPLTLYLLRVLSLIQPGRVGVHPGSLDHNGVSFLPCLFRLHPACTCSVLELGCVCVGGYRIEERPLRPPAGGEWLPWKREGRCSESGTARLWGETLPHPGEERQPWSPLGAGEEGTVDGC